MGAKRRYRQTRQKPVTKATCESFNTHDRETYPALKPKVS